MNALAAEVAEIRKLVQSVRLTLDVIDSKVAVVLALMQQPGGDMTDGRRRD